MLVKPELNVTKMLSALRAMLCLGVTCTGVWAGLAVIYALIFAPVAVSAVDDTQDKSDQPSAGTGMYSTYVDTRVRFLGDELGDSYPMPIDELLPALLDAVDYLSKYSLPEELPPVHRVPHAKIEQLACGKTCAALAAYSSGEGIYLDDALKPESNIFARSVLLHELVYYVQDLSNELAAVRPCERRYRREQEAYAIQKRFLALLGSQVRVGYSAGSACDHRAENNSDSSSR